MGEMKKEMAVKIKKIKSEIGKITKDKKNPFHKNNYFDINSLLEKLEPLLEKNELLLIQPIERNCISSKLIDIKTGDELVSSINLPVLEDPQKMGSTITYYRRYTLTSLLAIQGEEDDDGNIAGGKTESRVIKNTGSVRKATPAQIELIFKIFKENFKATPVQIKRSLGKGAGELSIGEAHEVIEKLKTKEGLEWYGNRCMSLD